MVEHRAAVLDFLSVVSDSRRGAAHTTVVGATRLIAFAQRMLPQEPRPQVRPRCRVVTRVGRLAAARVGGGVLLATLVWTAGRAGTDDLDAGDDIRLFGLSVVAAITVGAEIGVIRFFRARLVANKNADHSYLPVGWRQPARGDSP